MSRSIDTAIDRRRPTRALRALRRQSGVALIAVVVFIGIATAVYVVHSLDADAVIARQNQRNAEVLQSAREALLAFAATDANRPGALPCPDIDGDGRALPGVEYVGNGCQSYIGRLPWALLRIPELRDASGERLWYALSPGFRDAGPVTGNPGFVNPDTPAVLTIDGLPGTFGAIVFAPGAAMQGQARSGLGINALVNYLDGVNATSTLQFSAALPGPAFNDRLLPVSGTDLVAIAERRVSKEIAAALNQYFDVYRFLPFPATFDDVQCVGPGFVPAGGCQPAPGVLAGRIPGSVTPDAYASVGSGLRSALLNGNTVPPGQYDLVWLQLQRWREHVVYIVSPNCAGPPANDCAAGTLSVRAASGNVDNARFAVMMGGPPGVSQSRTTAADKSMLSNYLEGPTLSAAQSLAAGTVPAQILVPAGTVTAVQGGN
ncbi:MAG: hypothetical protein ACK5T2_09380 [bacterium]